MELDTYSTSLLSAPKYERPTTGKQPTKKQLLKRKSFGSVNDNPYLNKLFGVCNGQ